MYQPRHNPFGTLNIELDQKRFVYYGQVAQGHPSGRGIAISQDGAHLYEGIFSRNGPCQAY